MIVLAFLTDNSSLLSLVIAFALLIGICVLFPLIWFVPKRQAARHRYRQGIGAKELFEFENESRKTLSQIVGGVALLIGLAFTWWQIRDTEQSLHISEQGQITDRYTKAVEQLDHTKSVAVHLGGIYALERIALESKRDTGPIREVLAAFVRVHASKDKPAVAVSSPTAAAEATPTPIRQPVRAAEDVRAAIAVILNINQSGFVSDNCVDLSETDLRGVNFRNANLRCFDFDRSILRNVHFNGAHLSGASLISADLYGAILIGADLSNADLRFADLSSAQFWKATLAKTRLESADLDPALTLTEEQIERACVNADTVLPPRLTPAATLAITHPDNCEQGAETPTSTS